MNNENKEKTAPKPKVQEPSKYQVAFVITCNQVRDEWKLARDKCAGTRPQGY